MRNNSELALDINELNEVVVMLANFDDFDTQVDLAFTVYYKLKNMIYRGFISRNIYNSYDIKEIREAIDNNDAVTFLHYLYEWNDEGLTKYINEHLSEISFFMEATKAILSFENRITKEALSTYLKDMTVDDDAPQYEPEALQYFKTRNPNGEVVNLFVDAIYKELQNIDNSSYFIYKDCKSMDTKIRESLIRVYQEYVTNVPDATSLDEKE